MMQLLISFLTFTTIVCLCSAEIASIEVSRDNFDTHVAENNLLVAFHSKSCDASQRFFERYEKLAESVNKHDVVKLAYVDCDADKEFCQSHGAERLAVILFKKDEDSVQFTGLKNEEGLSKFLVKQFGDAILEHLLEVPQALTALNDLTDETFPDHVAVGNHFVKFYAPWCGHCKSLEPIWEELANSLEYDPSVSVSRVDCTQYRPLCQENDVKGYPSLLWFVDGKKQVKYSGPRKVEEFKKFIEEQVGKESSAQEKQEAEHMQLGVIELSEDGFTRSIAKGVSIVKFYAPWCGHCKRLAPTWDELAVKFAGSSSVKVAKVDCTKAQSTCSKENVDGYPTIFLYKDGQRVVEYDGDRSLDNLVKFVNENAHKRDEL